MSHHDEEDPIFLDRDEEGKEEEEEALIAKDKEVKVQDDNKPTKEIEAEPVTTRSGRVSREYRLHNPRW